MDHHITIELAGTNTIDVAPQEREAFADDVWDALVTWLQSWPSPEHPYTHGESHDAKMLLQLAHTIAAHPGTSGYDENILDELITRALTTGTPGGNPEFAGMFQSVDKTIIVERLLGIVDALRNLGQVTPTQRAA